MLTASSKSLSSRVRQIMTPIAPIGFCILLMQIGQIEALLQFNPTTSAHELRIPHSSPSRLRTSKWAEVDKGFNLLEIASQVVPQGQIVQTAKETVKFAWKVREHRSSISTTPTCIFIRKSHCPILSNDTRE